MKKISPENLMFTNEKGEHLPLLAIVNSKKIISITFTYLSKGRFVKLKGLLGKLNFKKEVFDEKIARVTSEAGISFEIIGIVAATLFSSKEEFEKIPEGSYNIATLWKQDSERPTLRYQMDFLIENLLYVNWVNKL